MLNKVTGQNIVSSLICGGNRVFLSFWKGCSNVVANYSTDSLNTNLPETENYDKISKPTKLVNEVVIAETLSSKLSDYRYDLISGDWFNYDKELGRWIRLSKYEIDHKIFSLLQGRKEIRGLLTSDYKNRVKLALEMLIGINFDSHRDKNRKRGLVPFLNGVLDLNKGEFSLGHNKDYYFTYGLNIKYDSEATMNQEMKYFLCSISNNNRNTLQVLRSFIKCTLLRDNQYQVALYLHGPGGTGKSTFEKLLMSLVGNKNSAVLTLEDLNRPFTISKIMDKALVLFSDVQSYTGDPSKLRLLISGDVMNAERKYKDSFDLQPKLTVLLSSNLLWSPKDSSTGLQRRIIYIHVSTVPKTVVRDLFNFNLATNDVSGLLAESLPGLVNWALKNPIQNMNLLNNAMEANKLLSPSILDDVNPLVHWIRSNLSVSEGAKSFIGKKNSDPDSFLFPNYLRFCKEYGYKPLIFNVFSTVLLQQLHILFDKNIEKSRSASGTFFENIQIGSDSSLPLEVSEQLKDDILLEFED